MTQQEEPGPSSSLPTSAEVVAALRDAGWLLEQDTAATLETKNFHVTPSKAFQDPDDPSVSREIDVHGYRRIFYSNELTLGISARIIAECKQSSMPYVFVGKPASEYEVNREREEQIFRFPWIETGSTDIGNGRTRIHNTPARTYLGLDRLPGNPWEGGFLGTQMTRLERKRSWVADNRGIFTSLVYPLAKAVTNFRSEAKQSPYTKHTPGQSWARIEFCYPLVVTSALLFTVDSSTTTVEAIETPWVTMAREIQSDKVRGRFVIDVVNAASLGNYIDERVNKFCSAVAELAEADPQRFITQKDHEYDPQ